MNKLPLVLVFAAACASEARLPASYFGQGTRALDPGHVALSGAVGGGKTGDGSGVGGGARIRVGIGDAQEIAAEVADVVLDSPSEHCTSFDCEPGENKRYTTRGESALVSWKREVHRELAVIAGLGVARNNYIAGDPAPVGDYHGVSVDGSFALFKSRPVRNWLELYVGGRTVVSVPVQADAMTTPRTVFGLSSAAGGMLRLSPHLDFFAEAGWRANVIVHEGPTFGWTAVGGVSLAL